VACFVLVHTLILCCKIYATSGFRLGLALKCFFILGMLEFMSTCCVTHITNVAKSATLEIGCECFILYSLSRSKFYQVVLKLR
jgi:hypothetical protein